MLANLTKLSDFSDISASILVSCFSTSLSGIQPESTGNSKGEIGLMFLTVPVSVVSAWISFSGGLFLARGSSGGFLSHTLLFVDILLGHSPSEEITLSCLIQQREREIEHRNYHKAAKFPNWPTVHDFCRQDGIFKVASGFTSGTACGLHQSLVHCLPDLCGC